MKASITYSFFIVLCFTFVEYYSNAETTDVCKVPETSGQECLTEFYSFFCHSIIKFDDSKIHSHLGCLRQGMKVDESYDCDETPMNIPDLSACDKNPIKESFDLNVFSDEFVRNEFYSKDIDADKDCVDELRVFNHNAENESNENYVKMFNKYVPVALNAIIKKTTLTLLGKVNNLCIKQLYDLTKQNMNV